MSNRRTVLNNFVALLVAVLLLAACAPAYKTVDLRKSSGLVWPAQPAKPRISHVASFYHPEQLGIEKGFFSWLGDLLSGEEETRLIRPMAITKTSGEVLYVADPGVKGIHRFDLRKKRYSLIRQSDDKLLPSPVGIAADNIGNIFVIDSELAGLFKIEKHSDVAIQVSLDTNLVQPTSIAFNITNSSFYITDTGEHKVKQFTYDGKLKSVIGKRGKENGEFNYPTALWIDKTGNLYVTDALNFRIQIFDDNGKFVRNFGKQGNGTGNLSRPKGIATDSHGHIYVVDALFHVFQLFDDHGNFLVHVGGQGQGNGQFWLPTGVFISEGDEIYIADSHNRRVQIFRYVGGQS